MHRPLLSAQNQRPIVLATKGSPRPGHLIYFPLRNPAYIGVRRDKKEVTGTYTLG